MTDGKLEQVHFKLTPEAWEDLFALVGTPIVSLLVWDGSLVDERLDEPVGERNRIYVDSELYLANQTLLELYGAAIFPDENSEPIMGLNNITQALDKLTREGARLEGVFTDEAESLILQLKGARGAQILMLVTAWIETTWSELPDA
ncbi:MAG: hypothetical protein GXP42_18430 [Chloroflexi bacterium]|nr:hypothetical protein [Chloroflexota bacterium]